MTTNSLRLALAVLVLAGSVAAQQPNAAGSAPQLNPNQIALLRWYPMNHVAPVAVGNIHSAGIAFDGANMWITGFYESTVTKVRASDGANLGSFAVGTTPKGIAFDGTSVWVSNVSSGTVTKLRASDGTVLGTFAVGNNPGGVVFDGTNIWVAIYQNNTVLKLRTSDGKVLSTFSVSGGPDAMAFDGANIWVAQSNGSAVTKLRAHDGKVLGTFTVCQPWMLAFDGANMWVTSFSCATVAKIRASDGTILGTFATGGDLPSAIAFDGQYIWVGNSGSDALNASVVKMRPSDGAIVSKTPTPQGAFAAAFDGANVWITGIMLKM